MMSFNTTSEDRYVSLADVPQLVRQAREGSGLSQEDAARAVGTSPASVERAEGQPYRRLFRLRKKLIERLTGCTLKGPYYRVVPCEGE